MTILFTGCSFTQGMELKDKIGTRYATHVCKEFGQLQWNEAKIGAGNDYISRTVQNAILGAKLYWTHDTEFVKVKTHEYQTKIWQSKHKNGLDRKRLTDPGVSATGRYNQVIQNNRKEDREGWPDLVVCMWSGINRHENLRMSNITSDWSWTINAWEKYHMEKPSMKATKNSRIYIDKQYEPGEEEYMRGYMMRIRNAHYNLRLTLQQMIATKYILKSKGIPQLHYLFSSGQYKPLLYLLDEKTYENTNNWWPSIDLNREHYEHELPFLLEEGFYDMTQRLNLPIGVKDHPLEEAHKAMAERIIGDIKKNEFLK